MQTTQHRYLVVVMRRQLLQLLTELFEGHIKLAAHLSFPLFLVELVGIVRRPFNMKSISK